MNVTTALLLACRGEKCCPRQEYLGCLRALPSAGAYAVVERGGTVRSGDAVRFAEGG